MSMTGSIRWLCAPGGGLLLIAALAIVACEPAPRDEKARVVRRPSAAEPRRATIPPWWEPACAGRSPLQVGQGVTPPRVLKRVDPEWPTDLRRFRLVGRIVIAAVVTEQGNVCEARVLQDMSGPIGARLSTAAVAAIKQWRFEAARKDGVPVSVVYNITINVDL
jgi:TonB family protein